MAIVFDEQKKLFRLDTADSSYVIGIFEENYLLGLYYGAKIPDWHSDGFLTRFNGFSPQNPAVRDPYFSPDTAPMEYGCSGAGDFRISALSIRNAAGNTVTDVRYVAHRIYAGKPEIPGIPSTYANTPEEAQTLEIDALDPVTGAMATLVYTVFEQYPVMTKSVRITNTGDAPMYLERVFSACMDFCTMDFDLISLYGRHCKERVVERRPLSHGVQGVESLRGVSGHSQNPFVALVRHGADETHGDAYGFNLVYSGNFAALAECDYNDTTRLIMGINPTDFEWTLQSGETFYAPEVVCVYSDKGLGEMSRVFHRFYNHNLISGKYKTAKRPLLINSWEAAYFDFDTDKLIAFAQSAGEMGVEMLVMDDGWFGRRDDDRSSLGDWTVNTRKLPGGLDPLIDGVHKAGLQFGIWFEPEMISVDSDLLRAHPDWHIHVPDRTPMVGRHQYVLDMTREDVRENIFSQMYAILSRHEIDYVKWDFNRNITDAGSALLPAERGGEFFHRFILGTYALMRRVTSAFPDILFEGCSGGGGRFDPAMLSITPQIWTSDNTDPIERLDIQFGTSLCYPASAQSAHVSACPRTGIDTRANVALWGTFGYELDPRKLTDDEREAVRRQIAMYHRHYDLIRYGDLYRIISPYDDPHYAAWEIVSADKSQCLFTMVCTKMHFAGMRYVRLQGLDADRYYLCEEDGETYSGAFLMRVGLNMSGKARKDGDSFTLFFCAR